MKWNDIRRRFQSRRRLFFTGAVLAVVGLLVDGFFIEPNRLELTTWHVYLPNLPSELDGYRVVQLSDLHRKTYIPDSRIRRAVDVADSTNPGVYFST